MNSHQDIVGSGVALLTSAVVSLLRGPFRTFQSGVSWVLSPLLVAVGTSGAWDMPPFEEGGICRTVYYTHLSYIAWKFLWFYKPPKYYYKPL